MGVSILALGACVPMPAENEAAVPSAQEEGPNWTTWGGGPDNLRYAPLDQIDASNFSDLQVAWRWTAAELADGPDDNWKATPLFIDGTLYIPTGGTGVAAIDPATGETLWTFEPTPRTVGDRRVTGSSRALAYWHDGETKRLLHNSMDGRLYSLDPVTGQLDRTFGKGGYVDLNENLLMPGDKRVAVDVGSTAPGIVVGDVIVVQILTNDTAANNDGTPGYVRGYDVRTGALKWTFHGVPWKGEFGNETWEDDSWRTAGSAGVWTMMSADPKLGLVYLPVESATNNFWGGQRPGDGLFGESIVALDARTGKRAWHFQILHHGIWDYDLPAAPLLHDIVKDGKTIPAITVLTKQAMSFVFDRRTGQPVWPIEERQVPTKMAVPGEKPSPTQPFPTKPEYYSSMGYHPEDVIDFTPEIEAEARDILSELVLGPMYTPPTLVGAGSKTKGTLVYPNYGGGSNWNGAAFDPETRTMFVPTRQHYMKIGLTPADPEKTDWKYVAATGGLVKLKNGLPANKPPWATITATDMDSGNHRWSRSIGGAPQWVRDLPELQGLDLDFDNMGQISVRPSPLATRSLLMMAESANIGGDPGTNVFRAYDKASGKVVGELQLPAKTSGAPMTYMHGGQQYVVVAVSEKGHPAELVALSLKGGWTGGRAPARAEAASRAAQAAPAVELTAAQAALGQDVFAANCSFCHGSDGNGMQGGTAPSLHRGFTLDAVKSIVSGGSAEMPAFSAILSAEELDAVSRIVAAGRWPKKED